VWCNVKTVLAWACRDSVLCRPQKRHFGLNQAGRPSSCLGCIVGVHKRPSRSRFLLASGQPLGQGLSAPRTQIHPLVPTQSGSSIRLDSLWTRRRPQPPRSQRQLSHHRAALDNTASATAYMVACRLAPTMTGKMLASTTLRAFTRRVPQLLIHHGPQAPTAGKPPCRTDAHYAVTPACSAAPP
jgi:hypothetical protein